MVPGYHNTPPPHTPPFPDKEVEKGLHRGSWALSPGRGQPASPFVTTDFPAQTDLGLKAQQ